MFKCINYVLDVHIINEALNNNVKLYDIYLNKHLINNSSQINNNNNNK